MFLCKAGCELTNPEFISKWDRFQMLCVCLLLSGIVHSDLFFQ